MQTCSQPRAFTLGCSADNSAIEKTLLFSRGNSMISRIAVLIASSSIIVSSAGAQYSHPIELGLDAGISVGLGDNTVTVIHFPVQALRLGFFLDKSKSIEPKVA